jgi:hypothetical protein
MLIIICYLENFSRPFAVCGCKVTQFPSVTQIFSRKSDSLMHIWGIIVQELASFSCILYAYYANYNEIIIVLVADVENFL